MRDAYASVPEELKALKRWVCFKMQTFGNRTRKIPVTPGTGMFAKVDQPDTWDTFEHALEAEPRYDGIGYVLGDGYFGVDLDHVIARGRLSEKAKTIIALMDTYTEVSPSGQGVHMIARGTIPPGERRCEDVEMYDGLRFFTVTGRPLAGTEGRSIRERTAEAAELHRTYIAHEFQGKGKETVSAQDGMASTVEQLVRIAESSANGDKFKRLYAGDLTGYETPSQADMALVNMLTYYAGDNAQLIDAAFRASGLMREKWDSRRGSVTYGEKTIRKAMQDTARPVQPTPKPRKKKDVPEQAAVPLAHAQRLPAPAADMPVVEGFRTMLDVGQAMRQKAPQQLTSTGLPELDKALGGGIGDGLVVLGAEPSMGKTTLALYLARQAAGQGSDVLFVSYEQRAEELLMKLLSGLRLDGGGAAASFTAEEEQLLRRVTVPERDADLSVNGLLAQIERFLASCQGRGSRPMVFVDYLQAVAMSQDSGVRYVIDTLIGGLRTLLLRYTGCIFVISSLNRQAYQTPVRLDAFKESGGIEYAADLVLGMHLSVLSGSEYQACAPDDRFHRGLLIENAMRETARQLQLTVLKNRNGRAGWSERLIFATNKHTFFEA